MNPPTINSWEGVRLITAILAVAAYLIITSLEAPIRHYFGNAVQVKDLFLILIILASMLDGRLSIKLLFSLVFLGAMCVEGLLIRRAGTSLAVIFGAKQILPWVAGLSFGSLSYRTLAPFEQTGRRFTALLFLGLFFLVTISCVADSISNLPWTGTTQTIQGQDIELSREWETDAIRRVAGVTRSSYEAATIICISAIVACYCISNPLFRILLKCAATAAVLLTTSKAPLVSFVLLSFASWIFLDVSSPGRMQVALRLLLLHFSCMAAIMLPLLSIFSSSLELRDIRLGEGFSASSVADRLEDVWPEVIQSILDEEAILGFGIGGSGMPLKIYAPEIYLSPDNIVLQLILIMGCLAAIPFLGFWLSAAKLVKNVGLLPQALGSAMIFSLNYGITAGVLENSWMSFFLFFGLAYSQGFSPIQAGSHLPPANQSF